MTTDFFSLIKTIKLEKIKVFIGYGGPNAEKVANKLRTYLGRYSRDLELFVASPESRDLLSIENTADIYPWLKNCDIALFVCDNETPNSEPIKKEIKYLQEYNPLGIMTLSKSVNCIPEELHKKWHPLHYEGKKPETSFCPVTVEIYRNYRFIQKIRELTNLYDDENRIGVQ